MTADSQAVYLLEDDEQLAREIVEAFAVEGIALIHCTSLAKLRVAMEGAPAALVILDRMIAGSDCLDALPDLRAGGGRVPVIIISSRTSVDDRILGLKNGGDDYLIKPFVMGELIARVSALKRRSADRSAIELQVGPLSINLLTRTARRGSRSIDLLPREFSLLEYMMRHAGQVVTRSMLLEDVWRYRLTTLTNVVDVHVGHLRRKVDGDGEQRMFRNVRGVGFVLDAGCPAP